MNACMCSVPGGDGTNKKGVVGVVACCVKQKTKIITHSSLGKEASDLNDSIRIFLAEWLSSEPTARGAARCTVQDASTGCALIRVLPIQMGTTARL